MKTKKVVFLEVALLMMVSLVLPLGCDTDTETETTYKEVTVDVMTLSIPTEWQRPEGIDEILRDALGAMPPELAQYYRMDIYGLPADDFVLTLMVMKMGEMVEAEGMTWEGWEAQMEAVYMTEEDFLALIGGAFITEGVEEVTQTLTLHHTIHGNEAIEGRYECRFEGEPAIINLLLVFAEYDLGMVMLLGEEASVAGYEDVWDTIRDSVQFQN
ncbi:hypothetical protein ES703_103536 [subsurface metagenome]